MDKEILHKIIEAGNLAPSGSNSQPWRFEVENGVINVFALPDKDHKVLNFRKRGTFVANGALVENMEIAARHFGYEPKTEISIDGPVFARMSFTRAANLVRDDLYEAMIHRHTNRKLYKKEALSTHQKNYIFGDVQRFQSCEVVTAEGEKINQIAKHLALDILITLNNKMLHNLLFQEILWEEKEQHRRHGLYVRTMEVKPPKSSVFKLMGNWKAAQFFAKLKIPHKIYDENVKTISSSSLLGAIAVKDNDMDFVEAGRLIQRIWIRATHAGLSLQLVTGVCFLWQQANLGDPVPFSEKDRDMIDKAYESVRDLFGAKNGVVALAFRVGYAPPPTAISHKRPPQITWG